MEGTGTPIVLMYTVKSSHLYGHIEKGASSNI